MTIPDDIVPMIEALAALNGMTPEQYAERWWFDVRMTVMQRGGLEAVQAEAAAINGGAA